LIIFFFTFSSSFKISLLCLSLFTKVFRLYLRFPFYLDPWFEYFAYKWANFPRFRFRESFLHNSKDIWKKLKKFRKNFFNSCFFECMTYWNENLQKFLWIIFWKIYIKIPQKQIFYCCCCIFKQIKGKFFQLRNNILFVWFSFSLFKNSVVWCSKPETEDIPFEIFGCA